MARWRACDRAQTRLGVKAAGGRWLGAVVRGAPGTLGLGRQETRGLLTETLVARARSERLAVPYQGKAWASEPVVTTACEPWGTDSDGAKLTACVVGVLTARAGALTCD
jgi:hypothetical protein